MMSIVVNMQLVAHDGLDMGIKGHQIAFNSTRKIASKVTEPLLVQVFNVEKHLYKH